jgi:hypothetical protein
MSSYVSDLIAHDWKGSWRTAYLRSLPDQPAHVVRARVLPLWMHMLVQVVYCTRIRIDNLFHVLRTHFVLHPCAGTRDQALSLKLIRIQQVPTE